MYTLVSVTYSKSLKPGSGSKKGKIYPQIYCSIETVPPFGCFGTAHEAEEHELHAIFRRQL